MQKYWYETPPRTWMAPGGASGTALKTAEPYVTTPNWATVSSLFEQYAPLAFAGSEEPGKVLTTIQQLATQ